jgi:cyclase
VCKSEVIDRVAAYLRFVEGLAGRAHAAGLTPLQAALQTDLGEYKDWLDAERLVGNLHRAYIELEGGAPGQPIDLLTAFGDMIAFNGGRPLRCLA